MRLLFITADSVGTPTGGGLVCRQEVEALRTMGDVSIVAGKDVDPTRFKMPPSPFLSDYLAMNAVLRRCEAGSQRPQLAHVYSGTFTCTVRYLKSIGVPVTYTVDAHERTETIREFETVYGEYPFPHVREPDVWDLYSEGVRLADLVIAPSQVSKHELQRQGCERIELIPHGTDAPQAPLPFPDSFAVGYLGQPGPDKGLRYLISAWGDLGYADSTLYLAGDGSDDLAPLVTANADRGQFELLGRVPQASDLYRRVTVYVQPSVTEGFGIEILEAMAVGRAVIVSDGAGGADVVTDGVDGFVVPRRDPAAIAERIRWCRANPAELAAMGAKAREKAKAYAWDIIRSKYARAWQELLA